MKTSNPHANPYPGLRPFEFHENHLFFGREGQSEELLRKLRRNRFLAVVGTSGSGKSSLVRAGLLPLLYGGFMTKAGARWRIALFRPGKDPIHNLAAALNSPSPFEPGYSETHAEESPADSSATPPPAQPDAELDRASIKLAAIETTLRRSAVGLADYVRRARLKEGENILVVVDQFEELFRFKEKSESANKQDEAAAFVKLLLECTADASVPVYIVLTMRSDFLGDCAQFRDLPERINESQYLIPRMTRDQQRDAITCPAAVRGARLTPRLLHRLLNDVGDNPDQLPILQHALMRTWDFWARSDDACVEIDLRHYEAIGGMDKALSLHADEAYDELPDERGRKIAERMFKALSETVTDNREVRRPSTVSELAAIAGVSVAEVIPVIEAFRSPGRSFLMPPARTSLAPETLIDISHESLIRNWALLKEWVKEEAQSARIYRRVAEAAALYREGQEGFLSDPALQFALDWRNSVKPNKEWAQRYHAEFDETLEFLRKSEERRAELAAAEEERQRLEAERERRELEAAQALAEAKQRQAEYERSLAEEQQRRAEAEQRRAEEERRAAEALAAARERETEIAQKLAEEKEQLAEVEHRRAEEQSRAARRFRFAAVALALMLVVAVSSAVYAFRKKTDAEAQRGIADDQKRRAQGEKENADKANHQAQLDAAAAEKAKEEALQAKEDALQAEAKEKKQRDIADDKARKLVSAIKDIQQAQQDAVKEKEKDALNREALAAFEVGDLEGAVLKFVKLHEAHKGKPEGQAWAEYNLGAVYRKAREYDVAAGHYASALELQTASLGAASPQATATLHKLAQVYREQGKHKEANERYEALLKIHSDQIRRHSDSNHPMLKSRQTALFNLKSEMAALYLDEARDAKAIARDSDREREEVMKALANQQEEKATRGKPPHIRQEIEALEALKEASLARRSAKFSAAEALYKEVAAFRERQYLLGGDAGQNPLDGFAPNQPELVNVYLDLAQFYQERDQEGDKERADSLYNLARTLRDEKLKRDHLDKPAEAKSLKEIAEAYARVEMHEQAESVYRRLMRLAPVAYEKDKPALATLNIRVGEYYHKRKKYADAERHYLDAMAFWEQQRDLHLYSSVMRFKLAIFYWEQQKHDLAEQSLQKFTNDLEADWLINKDKDSASTFTDALIMLALLQEAQKKLPQAEGTYRRALDLSREVFGANNGWEADHAFNLGDFYYRQHRYAEAEPLLALARDFYAAKIGPGNRGSGLSTDIMKTLTEDGVFRDGAPHIYVRALSDLAAIKVKQEKLQEAEKLYEEARAVLQWIQEMLPNSDLIASGDEAQKEKEMLKYLSLYAANLESYSELLVKLNQTEKANQLKYHLEHARRSLINYQPPPPWEY
ncbi:MAG TPA: tetratricopeptide repeat protein [Pyrinomonadaceae bacterium]|nr:tetratricopeptide repeat protein [Pyrinomonadaceae bacterium]